MWSRKPTPDARVPLPEPSSVRERLTSVSPVRRCSDALRLLLAEDIALIVSHACLHRARVPLESLGSRDWHAGAGELGRGLVVDLDLGYTAAEVVRRETGAKARGACGREDVVGAGDVVAKRGRTAGANEDAAGCGGPGSESLDLGSDELQVLRRKGVRDRQRLMLVGGLHEREACPALAWRRARELLQRARELIPDASAAGHAYDDAALPVLALREEVKRREPHLARARLRAQHDEQVARSGVALAADGRGEQSLGLLHVQVAGSHDDIDTLDRLGSERQRRDRLRAAHAVDPFDAAQAAGAEDRRVDLSIASGRRAHGHVEHSGCPGGDNSHHDGARIRRPATGYVDGGAGDGHLADGDALPLRERDDLVPD